MSPPHEKTIQHFTHPGHSLQQVSNNNQYLCDGCKTDGSGDRYRCDLCNFDLHEHCATCPAELASFIHPNHHLNLVTRKAQSERHNIRFCNVCGDQVEGMFYRCGTCDIDVHPLCTLLPDLPQSIRHAFHPDHPLVLQPSVRRCLVCKKAGSLMGYGCSTCHVDIHIECIISAGSAETTDRLISPMRPASAFQEHGAHDTHYHNTAHYNTNQSQGVDASHGGKRRRVMFYLVTKLRIASLTGTVFGTGTITYT